MPQSQLLVKALKQLLKANHFTYRSVGEQLNLSEASVKRMFAHSQITLERIDMICEMMGIELSDVFQYMQQMSARISQLTIEQEKKIVSDRKLCLMTVCVINHWSLADILSYFNLSELECIQYLAVLDKLKLIELLPKNKIKLLISPGFRWIANGPIQQFFQQYVLADYMSTDFKNNNEEMICQFGMLTAESSAILKKKLRHLAQEFVALSEQDANEPLNKRFGSVCFAITRPWATTIFNEFIRDGVIR